ncbi:conserved protein, unknown function [Plasmodium knowlesi strain H]|uniref:Trafficking protein particle complex subunit 13 N-terminal domain-containing protein n=3 Tax=Plasmodium knowlesi TaxID=5850 RepID=A0A5K1UMY5_PLAKH|nr:conserved protein, unknown function [Plasmodium knowlesi strain H]OTN67089.1 Uncharacterized protein PKNOH_S07470000 [Plasmodium knowlesi]CAA9988824.1 conserved protein, unknown function [Plasmodium knowlesi strain H]SBO21836.1 conserved protein, unknown function [Plasmodium knowlesi strain H]SBO22204.1 conserved protein, unknown function [Plasmodium knowlesi strain H]VVS78298.1 conserved protein, unknown function [Plasmodium knowlesi strain H]|eukprot:XP_002259803.1 hypothetical protein, conserved in Plasmodium species [Plasmodium knowlesi strain H]
MNDSKEGVKIELLRLNPPALNLNIWNFFNIKEVGNIDFEKSENKEDLNFTNEFSLSLPINSRKIYIGQNLKCQINISNNLKNDIQICTISVDVMTKQTTFNIYRSAEHVITVRSNSFFNFLATFLVTFADMFTVHCAVEYLQGSEKKKLRKDFNFISKNPFHLKTLLLQKEDKIYIQAVVRNIEEDNIMLTDVIFKGIQCKLIKNEDELKTHDGLYYLKQNDEYSMIFCVKDEESKLHILKTPCDENITNIEMLFFTSNGGKGINNSHFLKKNIITDNIRIYLQQNENPFYVVNKMYKLEIVFENNTDENIAVEIFIHNSSDIHVVNNFVKGHIIEKRKRISHFFYVLFVNPGIHFFNKITICNRMTKKRIDYVRPFKMFVK